MPSQPVPTRIRDIKLNNRVSLRRHAKSIGSGHRTLLSSGSPVAKPSVDYIPTGGFVFSREYQLMPTHGQRHVDRDSSFTRSAAWRKEKRRHGLG